MLLLIDADDTLWENNVYFERVIDEFIELLNHPHHSRQQVRRMVDDIERANAPRQGYGSASFGRNLQEAFCRLAQEPVSDERLAHIARLAAAIAEREVEIIEGVPQTLEYLAARHRLVLFTKGHEEEQRSKIVRSGLAGFFSDARVVPEKDQHTYRRATAELRGVPASTWMIGNSPRSDVNPALAAGLNAVWVPHPLTWSVEQEEVQRDSGRLLVVSRFAELRDHF